MIGENSILETNSERKRKIRRFLDGRQLDDLKCKFV